VETSKINLDETVWIRQCQQGNSDAMGRLILKYQDRIYNVILRICANPDDAADLTQEAFVKAITNIGKFQGKSSFYTWIFKIAVNLTLTYCKRNVRLGFKSLDAADEDAVSRLKSVLQNDKSDDPAAIARDRELCQIVVKSIMRLDDDQRTVVVLRDIEQMDYASIAEVLGIELGTVKSRLSRARDNLRDMLGTILK
jgi:RNA polymerase sigma-70 factor (ECF subfamily)